MQTISKLAKSLGCKPKKVKALLRKGWANAYSHHQTSSRELEVDEEYYDAIKGIQDFVEGKVNPEWEAAASPYWEKHNLLTTEQEAFLLGEHHFDGGRRWSGDSMSHLRWLIQMSI